MSPHVPQMSLWGYLFESIHDFVTELHRKKNKTHFLWYDISFVLFKALLFKEKDDYLIEKSKENMHVCKDTENK